MDLVLLSRLQFALTIMFHYIFPPLTIGLGVVLVYLEAMYLRTREPIYETAARFWTSLFAVTFAMGVATGIVMEFQFGTNWAAYSRYVGDVFGSALAAEGVFAFFLESGFLAILVFGWDRVSPRLHFFAALMVCLGAMFSAVWITVANSWQQTPAGSVVRDHVVSGQVLQRAEITSFWLLVFNPSSMHRLGHVLIAAVILGTFFVMSISAWYLLKNKHIEFARRSFTGALLLAAIACLAQLLSGDAHARNVAQYQPAKMAAFEGLYHTTEGPTPLYVAGWPNDAMQRVDHGLAVPAMLTLLIHRDLSTPVAGLDQLEPLWGRPPVWLSFQSYHLMIGFGMLFIAMTLAALLLRWRGTLFNHRWLLWGFVFAVLPAFAANQLGWIAAEVGRQPWVVYPTLVDGQLVGGLRTSDAVSEAVSSQQVLGSIIMFMVIYAVLFVVWLTVMNSKIQAGPRPVHPQAATTLRNVLDAASQRQDHDPPRQSP